MNELPSERQQSARLCDEVGRLKTMVAALTKEAGHVGELYAEVNSELKQVKEVLAWSSENVLFARFVGDPQNLWFVDLGIVHPIRYHAPTLYEALWSAWKSRDDTTHQRKDK